jgi:hypothetical protein
MRAPIATQSSATVSLWLRVPASFASTAPASAAASAYCCWLGVLLLFATVRGSRPRW